MEKICCVCFEKEDLVNNNIAFDHSYKLLNKDCCKSSHHCCNKCIEKWICLNVLEKNSNLPNILCMAQGCKKAFNEDYLIIIIQQLGLFEKFADYTLESGLQVVPGFKICPSRSCSSFMIVDLDSIKECSDVVCWKCNYSFCFNCVEESHKGFTCLQAAANRANINISNNSKLPLFDFLWISIYTKNCPNCNWNIEKNKGCNSMTCSKCNFVFCWSCSKQFGASFSHPGCYQNMMIEQKALEKLEADTKKAILAEKRREVIRKRKEELQLTRAKNMNIVKHRQLQQQSSSSSSSSSSTTAYIRYKEVVTPGGISWIHLI
jgi:hypothetical protein